MNATVSHQMPHSAHFSFARKGEEAKETWSVTYNAVRSTVYLLRRYGYSHKPRATGRPSASRNRQIAPEIEQRTEKRP